MKNAVRDDDEHEASDRSLETLLLRTEILSSSAPLAGVRVRGVASDSRDVEPGSLFVAISGTTADGHDHLSDVVARGAAALIVDRPVRKTFDVPVVRVESSRRALAQIAALWHGTPAEHLRLVGITGTIGKTSVLKMLEAVLLEAGERIGTIGSLGVRIENQEQPTGYTAPDPLLLHEALARIRERGCTLAAMEVTSHALDQERVHGLRYDLGIFTNLVPLEHSDYHGSFRGYVRVKRRFFDHLRPGIPLVYSADDRAVRRLAREADVNPVGCGLARTAVARVEAVEMDEDGTSLVLHVRRPLPRVDGGAVDPVRLPLRLRLLGRGNVANAALAATAALCLGVDADAVRRALEQFPPPSRRMEVVWREPFLLIDDSIGHPDSVSALFDAIQRLGKERVHAVFAIRGMRGEEINARTAEALATWIEQSPLETLVVTHSSDAADERNRVLPSERDAFLAPLRSAGVIFEEQPRLADAVATVLQQASSGDLVLLLGAQGMDRGHELAERWLQEHGATVEA